MVGDDLARDDGDLTRETSLLVLDLGGHTHHSGGERPAGGSNLVASLGASSGDVLHGVREASISEGSLLGELAVGLAELAVGTTLGLGHGGLQGGEHGHLASSRGSVGTTDGSRRGLAGSIDLRGEGSDVGLHGSLDGTGVAGHLVGVGINATVGLLDLLGSLALEGEHATVETRHGISQRALGGLGGGTELASDGRTGSGGTAGSSGLVAGNLTENSLGGTHGGGEVVLGLGGGGADSVEHLLAHLSASRLGGETEVLHGLANVLGELGNLGSDTHVEGSLGLGGQGLEAVLNTHHAGLTLADSTGHSTEELGTVSLHRGGEHSTATAGLDGVGVHDTSQLLHLTVELAVVTDDGGVELGHAATEVTLGVAEGVLNVKAGTTSLAGKLLVDSELGTLGLRDGGVQLGSLASEHAGSMAAVAAHGGANLVDLVVVMRGHGVHAGDILGLVAGDEALELLVPLEVSLVAVVTELDHTLGLGVHVGVHLSLGKTVLLDLARELADASVGHGNLLLHGGAELEDVHLELSLGGGDLAGRLGLGGRDVAHSGGETTVVEGREGVQGSLHTGGRGLECHVSVGTVAGHTGASLAELRGSGGNDLLELVGSPGADSLVLALELGSKLGAALLGELAGTGDLAVVLGHSVGEGLASGLGVLLDLGGIGRHVLVGLVNASVGRRAECGHGTLLSGHGHTELVSGTGLVLGDTGEDKLVAVDVDLVTPVGKLSSACETELDVTHGTAKIAASLTGIDGHPVEENPLQLLACGLVESEVAVHLGTDGRDVTLARALLAVDLLLNILEIIRQAHAAVGGVGHNSSRLLHISACHGGRATHGGHCLRGTEASDEHRLRFFLAIRSEVDHGAANRKRAHNHNC